MNGPPRICHLFTTFEPGGMELRTARLINALGPRYAHTIMAIDGRYGAAASLDRGAHVRLVPPPPRTGRVSFGMAMRSTLRALAPDVLATYSGGVIYGVISGRLAGRWPIVHHESGFELEAFSLRQRRWLTRRLLLPATYATVVPSRTLAKVVRTRYGQARRKVIHIPNGVDLTRFRPRPDRAWRKSLGVPDRALVFGTVCRLRPVKNLSLLLRAFARARLPDARLIIVGDGPCRARWEDLARRLGLRERAIFAGATPDPAPCYAGLDVFVMSSASEQMPNALLEGMACGLPAICTDVGDSREMLGNAHTPVIVPRDDEAAYAGALVTLARHPELRATLGAANRARCVERYSLERMVEAHAAVYDAAIGRGAQRQ